MIWEKPQTTVNFRPIKEKRKEVKNIKCGIFFIYKQKGLYSS